MRSKEKQQLTRRHFIHGAGYTAGAVVTLGFLFGLPAKQAQGQGKVLLPPPGALPELKKFHAACVRCGQCVQACPYNTLKLATLSENTTVGTPYFVARSIPCEMCEDIPCVKACPSGALDQRFEDIYTARMGLAVLIDQEACIAWQGLRCEICYNVCPAMGKAITLDPQHNTRTGVHAKLIPTVHSEHCTGCGKCEKACILDEAAIKVLPINLAKGKLGQHYRLSWEEKEKAGRSLVPSSPEMEIRLPQGQQKQPVQQELQQGEDF